MMVVRTPTRGGRCLALIFAVTIAFVLVPAFARAAQPLPQAPQSAEAHPETSQQIQMALVRLPLAAVLGAALALRPRRKGTPTRTPAVVQTQIILSVVGAVIMLVVGASLARAFGIVGAANLIRYRSKIDDPKDAVVMLAALAVGLASGVGLYALAAFSTGFLMLALGIIESFEKGVKRYELKIKIGDQTDELRPRIEAIFKRFELPFEVVASADEEVAYEVAMPLDLPRDRVTNAILRLDPEGHASVDWAEKKAKSK
jgi:uncharacterized membrane protein YhiD involved in acid resistance